MEINTMEDNKYYTPDPADMHLGYEYEQCWNDHADIWSKEIVGVDWSPKQAIISIDHGGLIRVSYLTEEDIESCGWIYVEGGARYEYGWEYKIVGKNVYDSYEMTYWYKRHGDNIPRMRITQRGQGTQYDGKCPSINELHTIQRLLGIE